MEMDKAKIDLAPGRESGEEVQRVYDRLGEAVEDIARWLREHGVVCQSESPRGGSVSSPPLAAKAGLGHARRDMITALLTLKYTQSNSVCFAVDGQAIGVGAGQQSRIHCTRLAGSKADTWQLRTHEKVLSLPFLPKLGRPDRDNAVDGYINQNEEDIRADGVWQRYFTHCPEPFTPAEARAYLDMISGVSLGSDAFFPFTDNIERAVRSGVSYIAEPGGSVRDDEVVACCDKYGVAMAFTGIRLFHH